MSNMNVGDRVRVGLGPADSIYSGRVGVVGDMQVENVSASESVLASYRAPSAEQTRWAFVGAGS